ncbi:MAG: hypothetical protein ISR73_07240 [Gammaproteobacteria bacterium]|nr:hypothetical protein [Gammaproteobacteria bacterium]
MPSDAYIMLPQSAQGTSPTVHLLSTIFPAETEITISAETTAIGLVTNSILRHFLLKVANVKTVRGTIRLQALAFIQNFSSMIESDLYTLHFENLPAVDIDN